jgi:hypothetical protein
LGVSRHDDDTGVYISLDLLKLFEDKSSILDKFRDVVN